MCLQYNLHIGFKPLHDKSGPKQAFGCTSNSFTSPPMLQPVVGTLHHFTHLRVEEEEEEEIQEGKMKVCKG